MKVHKHSTLILLLLGTAILCAACAPDDQASTIIIGGTGGGGGGTPSSVFVMLTPNAIANSGSTVVTATVTDTASSPVSGVTVSFTVSNPAAGTFTPANSAVTNGSGVATVTFTANAAVDAAVTITALATYGTTTISGGATLTIGTPPLVPTAISVSCTPTSIPLPPGSTSVSATVMSGATPVSGATVNFTVSDVTAGSFTAASATTGACPGATCGIATTTFNANAVSMFVNITAAVGLLSSSAVLQIGTPPPPTPANLTISINPLTIDIQQTTTVTVVATDSTGAPAAGASIDFSIPLGFGLGSFDATDPLIDTITQTADSNGQVIVTFYAGASSGAVTIKATATAASTVFKQASLSITSLPANISVVASPSVIQTTLTSSIQATVTNRLGNSVSDGTVVSFSIFAGPSGAGTIDATASTVNGVAQATFTASATVTGDIIISASAGTSPDVVTGNVLVTIQAANASSVEFFSATPIDIGVVGSGKQDYSIVTFLVKDSNGNPKGGELVDFQLYGPAYSYIGSTQGSVTDQQSTISSGTNIGKVSTILHAGTVPGPARITASVTIPGTPPTIITTSSGNISIGGAVPSDNHFSLATKLRNIDGLSCYGVTNDITAFVADRYGNYNILAGTQVSFVTEAGAIDTSAQTSATNGQAVAVFSTQAPEPADVAPIAGEPSYVDAFGRTRNPRDGWVTILATTTGEETFVDNNANGYYDTAGVPPDTYTDVGEPYLDVDDSNTWTSGELFFDWPSYVPGGTIGVYNTGNTAWDQKVPIYKKITLVLTSWADAGTNTSHITDSGGGTGPISIAKGASAIFYVYASDINMNPPMGGTTISASVSDSSASATIPAGMDKISDGISMLGPARIPISVKNNISGASSINIILSATVTVKSKCGDVLTTFSYPSLITLLP